MKYNARGGLVPLNQRKTPQALVNRQAKILARQTVADKLHQSMAVMAQVINQQSAILRGGFWQRLWWLLRGVPKVKAVTRAR